MPHPPSDDPSSHPSGNESWAIGNSAEPLENDESTGLPLISTWARLYVFVLATFVLVVIALLCLTRFYS